MRPISRREFGALVAAGVIGGRLPTPAVAQRWASNIPASEVLDRIRSNIGVAWREQTVDTVKAGVLGTIVTGIVTTSNASIDVLRKAIDQGANMVITSEPTFYGRGDSRTPPVPRGAGGAQAAPPPAPRADPVYDAKNQLIDSNRLVVLRLSDHWGMREPNGFEQGLADAVFGPGALPTRSTPGVYDVPAVPLSEFASDVKQRLGSTGGIRVIGDPNNRVRKVAVIPGTIAIADALRALPSADVLLTGEVREWESTEYARDVEFSGQPRALITVGRILSEDPGMRLCAQWLQPLVPEVSVRHISAGDPYWRPEP